MAEDQPPLPSIDVLNQLPADEFCQALKSLFEAAGPLGEALASRRPLSSYADLIDQAERLTTMFPESDRVVVLNAHPRIGERADRVSLLSYREQGYASESDRPADELSRVYRDLAALNDEYERRFGFRFVVFVHRRPKAEILDVLRRRIANERQQELTTGIAAIFLIARDRLNSMQVAATDSIGAMEQESDEAYVAVLEELRRAALVTFGEERVAETTLQTALTSAAIALWRVNQELLEPQGNEPFPTHG